MKRLFALILAVSMLLSMASVGFAEGGTAATCTHENKTYTASANDSSLHTVYCQDCKQYLDSEAHKYGETTNKCTDCGAEKPTATKHDDTHVTEIKSVSKTTHGTYCTECKKFIGDPVACTWGDWKKHENGAGLGYKECTATGCTNKLECAHDADTVTKKTYGNPETKHATFCTICSKADDSTAEDHTFNCAGVCTVCGYTNVNAANKAAHVWGTDNAKPVEGGHNKVCKNCGAEKSTWYHTAWKTNELPEKAYLKSDTTSHWYVCKECGGVFGYAAHVEPAGEDEWTKTTTDHSIKCTVCEYVFKSGKHQIAIPATCTDNSSKCTVCGYYDNPTGHDYKYASDAKQHWQVCANCGLTTTKANHASADNKYDENGLLTCKDCGAKFENPNHQHMFQTVNGKAPTCTEAGYTSYEQCINGCYLVRGKEVIPSLHEQGDCLTWVEVVPASCKDNKAAQYQLTCKFYDKNSNKCLGENDTIKVYGYKDENGKFHKIPAGQESESKYYNHTWDGGKTTAADCCNNAYTVYTCTACKGKKVVVAKNTATGHKMSTKRAWFNGSADKCQKFEVEYYECVNCGFNTYNKPCKLEREDEAYKFKQLGDATAASLKDEIYKDDAASENKGYKIVNKSGDNGANHNYGDVVIVDKGCVKGKFETKVCKDCGYKWEATNAVDGSTGSHAVKNECTLVGNRATCTEDGYYYYECPKCGLHLYEDGDNGLKEITDKSGYKKEDKIGHDFEKVTAKCKAATCVDCAYDVYACENCKLEVKIVLDGIISDDEKVYYDTQDNVTSETTSLADPDAHKWEKGELIYGSEECGKTGWYKKVCALCGAIDADNMMAAENEHTYALVGTATVEPSCKGMNDTNDYVAGAGTIKCTKCGHVEESTNLVEDLKLTKPAHNWKMKVHLDADCEKAERTATVCLNCGATKDEVNVPNGKKALDHDYSSVVINDCTMVAAEIKTCNRCGEKTIDYRKDVGTDGMTGLKHENIKRVDLVKKTCLKDGKYYEYCADCGQFVQKNGSDYKTVAEYVELTDDATGQHTFDAADTKKNFTVAANCSEGGYTSNYCTVCGETVISNKTEAIAADKLSVGVNGGHKDWKVIEWKFEGNCTQDGVAMYGCPYCGKTGANYALGEKHDGWQDVPAGHDFPTAPTQKDIKNILVAPTCDKTGVGTTVCSRCGAADSVLRTINATGKHNYGLETVKSTTCGAPDVTYYYCLDCHVAKTGYNLYLSSSDFGTYDNGFEFVNENAVVKIGTVGAHKYELETRKATCEDPAGTYKVCSVCGYVAEKPTTGTGLGHVNKTITETEATCYQTGKKVTYCLRCGKTITEETIPATSHKLVENKEKSYEGNCVVAGYTVWTCQNDGCDYEKTTVNTLNANNHAYVTKKVYREADCKTKQNGVELKVCKYHSNVEKAVVTSWMDCHEWTDGEVVTTPTCTLAGSMKIACSKCGATSTKTLKANGHSWATRNVAASCEKGSYIETYCTVCNAVAATTEPTGVALGHDMLDKVYVEPTCEKDGYWSTKCSRCDYEVAEKDNTEPAKALGHNYKFVETVKPTCKDKGYDLWKCTRCESTQKKNEKATTNEHNYLPVDETIKVPACNEEAIYVYAKCSVCGKAGYQTLKTACKMSGPYVSSDGKAIYNVCLVCGKIEIIDSVNGFDGFDGCMTKQGNNWVGSHTLAGGKTTEATCEEAGKITKLYCTKCGTVLADEVELEAKGHTEVKVDEVPATCTEDGTSAWSYCSVCKKVLVEKETIKAGHKLVEVEAAVEATCTTDGKTATKKCEDCDYTEGGEVVKAKGHVEEILPAVDATESKPGLTEGKKCSVCGEILVAQTEVAQKAAKLIVPAILRAAGYDKAATLTRVYKDTEVKILEAANENNYYKVEVLGQIGYMHKSYIEIL